MNQTQSKERRGTKQERANIQMNIAISAIHIGFLFHSYKTEQIYRK